MEFGGSVCVYVCVCVYLSLCSISNEGLSKELQESTLELPTLISLCALKAPIRNVQNPKRSSQLLSVQFLMKALMENC